MVQQEAVAAYIDSHAHDFMAMRTYRMYTKGLEMSWGGPSTGLYNRYLRIRNVKRVRDVMGIYSHLGTHDSRAPHGGAQEVFQRVSFVAQHGAGTLNIAKVILARCIGISRTKERAAVTPSTAAASQRSS